MTERELINITKRFWNFYLMEPTPEHFQEILSCCSDSLTIIGTGKHEVYHSLEEAAHALLINQQQAAQIQFEIVDDWYAFRSLSETICLVYGGLWVREKGISGSPFQINMDTRFSVIFRREKNEVWKILHIHQSTPNIDQADHEFYPKTLSQQVKDALQLADEFRYKSELDLMTGLYNHVSFHEKVERYLESNREVTFFLIDLDHFKSVNDTYGHGEGDKVLKRFSRLLQVYTSSSGILGRLGGDEFAVLEPGVQPKKVLEQNLFSLQKQFRELMERYESCQNLGCTAGICRSIGQPIDFDTLYRNADEALYYAKRRNKGSYCFYEDITP
ncbi:diguanylate cyclase [Lacrimispora sp. NSJ-141]|uniref:Diguanylate cyclase n=1 Tax=Lientehia hominis TaxID=2897778 RepID=A0AAP2RH54_9FIRM|nr:diguanylate cyclase [Lientehia hominis]MCD2491796.1 diguanylate cyclase [Lientehia hominis]